MRKGVAFLYIMINLLINNNLFCVSCMKQLMKSQSKLWYSFSHRIYSASEEPVKYLHGKGVQCLQCDGEVPIDRAFLQEVVNGVLQV